MIQRIQSFYLFITSVLSFGFISGGIINFSELTGSSIKVTFSTILREGGMLATVVIQDVLPLTILIILIPIISMVTIFIFKNRVIQLIFAKILLVLISVFIIALAVYSYLIMNKYDAELILGFKMFLPLIQLIFSYLAYRGIKKDDNLVKSYDRLR